jgi:PAS domain S-box-containing protein
MMESNTTTGTAEYLSALRRLLEEPELVKVFGMGAQAIPQLVGPCIAQIVPLEELEGAFSDSCVANRLSLDSSPLGQAFEALKSCSEETNGWAVLDGGAVKPLPESIQTGSRIIACAIPISSGENTYGTLVAARPAGAESFSHSHIALLESHTRLMATLISATDKTACLRHEVSVYGERDHELTATIQRWIDILDSCADLILAVDAQGTFAFCNQTWHEVLGYTPEQRSDMVIFDIIHSSHHDRWRKLFTGMLRGHIPPLIETQFVTAAGDTLDVEGQIRVVCRGGHFLHTVGIFRNVTERNRMQRELAETSAHAKFLEGVHQTSVTLQHEINNPLTALMGDLELAEPSAAAERMPMDLVKRLEGLHALAQRIANTVKRLRDLYDPISSVHPVAVDEGVAMIDLTKSR